MGIRITCDYCGGEIGNTEPFVTFKVAGTHSDGRWSSGWHGHYHTNEQQSLASATDRSSALDCWERVDEALKLIHDVAPGIAELPNTPEPPTRQPTAAPAVTGPTGSAYFERASSGTPLSQVVHSQKAIASLRRADLVTVEEAADRLETDVGSLDGVGQATMASIRGALRERGLDFAPEPLDREEVARRVRDVRTKAGESRERFASQLDVAAVDVSKWERTGWVSSEDRRRIADVYGLEASYLGVTQ